MRVTTIQLEPMLLAALARKQEPEQKDQELRFWSGSVDTTSRSGCGYGERCSGQVLTELDKLVEGNTLVTF